MCEGKSKNFPSEEKNEERYKELKTEIDDVRSDLGEVQTDLNDVKTDLNKARTDIDDARTDLDDVQERNYAFKYSGASEVKSGTIVNFKSRVYGEGVNNGVYTAPIGKHLISYFSVRDFIAESLKLFKMVFIKLIFILISPLRMVIMSGF